MDKKEFSDKADVHQFSGNGYIKNVTKNKGNGTVLQKPYTTQNKTTKKKDITKKAAIPHPSRPVIIGSNNDPDKWRCKVCKYLNSNTDAVCNTCKEPKCEIDEKELAESIKKTTAKPIPKPIPKKTSPSKLGAPKKARKLEISEEEALKVSRLSRNLPMINQQNQLLCSS